MASTYGTFEKKSDHSWNGEEGFLAAYSKQFSPLSKTHADLMT
jgi:hypothetical protein